MRTSNWHSLSITVGSLREQSRRERNGTRHKETAAINRECNEDKRREHIEAPAIDKARIKAEVKRERNARLHDDIRARFGPRLIKRDGTCRFTFQCKK